MALTLKNGKLNAIKEKFGWGEKGVSKIRGKKAEGKNQ